MHIITHQHEFDAALRALLARDARLNGIRARCGDIVLRRREAGFAGLCAIIIGQQLSIASAGAIWGRLAAAFDPLTPEAIRRARNERLARIGLSAAKIRALKAIARALDDGDINLDEIAAQDADSAIAALNNLHGVGPWTANIYLLFCLGHRDVWPTGDIALHEAMRHALGLSARPSAREAHAMADIWRPYRGVAAHLLWAYYKVIKARDVTQMPAAQNAESQSRELRSPRQPAAHPQKGRRNGH